jgi:hypothetical protein
MGRITEVVQSLGLLYPRNKQCINFLQKNRVGLYFGRFFHELVWSPCQQKKLWNSEHEKRFPAARDKFFYHAIKIGSVINL